MKDEEDEDIGVVRSKSNSKTIIKEDSDDEAKINIRKLIVCDIIEEMPAEGKGKNYRVVGQDGNFILISE